MSSARSNWTPDPFATDFERRVDGTMLLTPRQQLGEYPARITDLLEHWASTASRRTFVARRGADGVWLEVSYGAMLQRVRSIAAGLVPYGLSTQRPIVILSGNSIEHLTIALAAMWIGVPYCPVSPAYAQASSNLAKLRHVMRLLTPGVVAAFDTGAFTRALSETTPPDAQILGDAEVGGLRVISLDDLAQPDSAQLDAAHAASGPDTIAKFLLTSGSTGEPKAVITTQRMLCSNALMLRQPMPFVATEPPVLVDWLPWNHTFGGSHNVGLVLLNGGSLYIDDGKPTPAGFAQTVSNLREISPTVYFNVPKGFEMLAHQLEGDAVLRRSFYRSLNAYFFAGASLAQHTWDVLDATSLKERGVRTPMLSGLGATETGPSVTFTTPDMGRAGVIGLPAAGNVVKLTPVDEKLEIRVRSPSVTPGYWRQPELTAAAFDEEGFYRMGDAVRLLDERDPTRGLKFDGRIDENFKLSNGTWVSVGPLRVTLIAALSPLAQDVVIAGLDRDFLAALIIPDLKGCARLLGMPATPTFEQIASHPGVLAHLHERLEQYAHANRASSHCVQRALLLPSAPSLDHGEITDKGSINQRAVLRQRAECVDALYAAAPPGYVVSIATTDEAGMRVAAT
jgi:feruloyl-CoA synthase